MKKITLLLLLVAKCAGAFAADIAVVAPGTGFGLSLGRHIVRWLGMNGVEADFVDEKTISSGLKGKKLAYLVMPKESQLPSLKSFAAQGGKMFAFYSDSPKVASFFGVKMGVYKKSERVGPVFKDRIRRDRAARRSVRDGAEFRKHLHRPSGSRTFAHDRHVARQSRQIHR